MICLESALVGLELLSMLESVQLVLESVQLLFNNRKLFGEAYFIVSLLARESGKI